MKLDLSKDERITNIKIFSDNLVDRIEVKTSLGSSREFGGKKKDAHQVSEIKEMTDGSRLVALKGGLGGHLHNM